MARKIMIVDDHVDGARGFREYFELHGYDVSHFADGIGALEAVARESPDVIVLDLSMPTMTGDEVLHTLVERRVATRVIMLSGVATDAPTIVRLVRGGACDYLIKPCAPGDLLAAVRRAIEMEQTLNLRIAKLTPVVKKLMAEATTLQEQVSELKGRLADHESKTIAIVEAKDKELTAMKRRQWSVPTFVRIAYVAIAMLAVLMLSTIREIGRTTTLLFFVALLVVLMLPLDRVRHLVAKGWNAEAELGLDEVDEKNTTLKS